MGLTVKEFQEGIVNFERIGIGPIGGEKGVRRRTKTTRVLLEANAGHLRLGNKETVGKKESKPYHYLKEYLQHTQESFVIFYLYFHESELKNSF